MQDVTNIRGPCLRGRLSQTIFCGRRQRGNARGDHHLIKHGHNFALDMFAGGMMSAWRSSRFSCLSAPVHAACLPSSPGSFYTIPVPIAVFHYFHLLFYGLCYIFHLCAIMALPVSILIHTFTYRISRLLPLPLCALAATTTPCLRPFLPSIYTILFSLYRGSLLLPIVCSNLAGEGLGALWTRNAGRCIFAGNVRIRVSLTQFTENACLSFPNRLTNFSRALPYVHHLAYT